MPDIRTYAHIQITSVNRQILTIMPHGLSNCFKFSSYSNEKPLAKDVILQYGHEFVQKILCTCVVRLQYACSMDKGS